MLIAIPSHRDGSQPLGNSKENGTKMTLPPSCNLGLKWPQGLVIPDMATKAIFTPFYTP
jgi:hypothetical protein